MNNKQTRLIGGQGAMNRKQRVLLISHAYVAPENRRKLECLAAVGDLEVGVVFPRRWRTKHGRTMNNEQKTKNREQGAGYQTYSLGTFFQGNAARYFFKPRQFKKVLRRFKPRIVHLEEEPWSWAAFQVALLSLAARWKLIIFTWENLEVPMSPWQRLVERFVLSRAGLVIAGSREARQRIKRRGFKKRVEVLPQFGVDQRVFKPSPSESLKKKLGLGKFTVGFVARLVEEKGFDTLLEAVAPLKDVRVLLVTSSATIPDQLRQMAQQLGVTSRLVVASNIPNSKLSSYYSLMNVLVLPSKTTPVWKEQFGRVLIEAMACKALVIGSSSGAIPEVIGERGLIFKEGDVADLRSKIKQVYTSPKKRSELAEKGYQRVLENFTFEKIAQRTVQYYSLLLS